MNNTATLDTQVTAQGSSPVSMEQVPLALVAEPAQAPAAHRSSVQAPVPQPSSDAAGADTAEPDVDQAKSTHRGTGHIVNGVSKVAVFFGILSIPLAVIDVYFFRIIMAERFDWGENSVGTWIFALALALTSLGLMALAGRQSTQYNREAAKKWASLFVAGWALIGILFFIFRVTAPQDTGETALLDTALLFLGVYLLDGLMAFGASKELFNQLLWDFLRNKKRSAELAKACNKQRTLVETAAANMKAAEGELEALRASLKRIDKTYFSEAVPSYMIALLRAMRDKDLITGPASSYWDAIGYDAQTRRPLWPAGPKGEPAKVPTLFG